MCKDHHAKSNAHTVPNQSNLEAPCPGSAGYMPMKLQRTPKSAVCVFDSSQGAEMRLGAFSQLRMASVTRRDLPIGQSVLLA